MSRVSVGAARRDAKNLTNGAERSGAAQNRRSQADLPRVLYDRAMERSQFFDDDFQGAVRVAGAQARIEILQAGVPFFYRDRVRNLNMIEHPERSDSKL